MQTMGAYLSSDQPLPDLPDELIEQIIMQTPTSTLFASAIYVNKKWNDIGRRNAIWIPRYRQMTGKTLNPANFKEYEVFPLFMEESENELLGKALYRPIGSGSYNCALLVQGDGDEDYVLRIAALKDASEWTLRSIPRGAAIVHLFQEYQSMLGPALLKEVAEGHYRRDIRPAVREFMCESIRDKPGPFYVQAIEHLQGGHMPTNMDSREAQAFPLIWFLHVAQNYFNFRHGDLKRGNVVFRTYDPPQRFTFRYNEEMTFSYEFHKVPVVIDFDFAAVVVTEQNMRRGVLGTPYTVPPEAAYRRLKRLMRYPRDQLFEYDDWWSAGIILFEYWTGLAMYRFVEPYLLDYARNMLTDASDHNMLFPLRAMLSSYVLVRGLYPRGQMPEAPREMYPEAIRPFLRTIPNYGILLNTFQLNLLRQLFSWDPNERGKNILRRNFEPVIGFLPDFQYNDVVYPSREALEKMRSVKQLK